MNLQHNLVHAAQGGYRLDHGRWRSTCTNGELLSDNIQDTIREALQLDGPLLASRCGFARFGAAVNEL